MTIIYTQLKYTNYLQLDYTCESVHQTFYEMFSNYGHINYIMDNFISFRYRFKRFNFDYIK